MRSTHEDSLEGSGDMAVNMLLSGNAERISCVCSSRLASKIFLAKELNNLSVALGKLYPWQTI